MWHGVDRVAKGLLRALDHVVHPGDVWAYRLDIVLAMLKQLVHFRTIRQFAALVKVDAR